MIYLPFRKTRKILILLFALITFHVCFETTFKKDFTTEDYGNELAQALGLIEEKKYAYGNNPLEFLDIALPEETAVLIYIGYFIIATRIVLLVQVVKKDSSDEIKSDIKK